MPWWVLFLLTVIATVTSETHTITAKIGSDLRLPVPKSELWDLYAGVHHLVNYHQGFNTLNGYQGRLEYSSEPNTIILKKWTRADGLDFRFAVKRLNGNNQITSYDVNYKVSVDESLHGDTRNNMENVFSSSNCLTVYTIFSLPSVLGALVIGIFRCY